ncbi:MAG: hypothetical protein RR782_02815 [Clostridium sp.]
MDEVINLAEKLDFHRRTGAPSEYIKQLEERLEILMKAEVL